MIMKEDRNDNDILIVYHSICIDFVYFSHYWVSLHFSSSFALANSTRFNIIATVLLTLLIEFIEFYFFYSLLLESNL